MQPYFTGIATQPSRSLKNRNYALLVGGRATSTLGDFFGATALSVIIYALTGSPLGLGITWMLFFLPRSVVRLLGGVHIDRLNRRRLMAATEAISGLLFAVLSYESAAGSLQVWMVYSVSLLTGAVGALFDMANDALLPSIVPREKLVRANSVMDGAVQGATVLGWAMGGVAVVFFSAALALAVDSASFFALVLALLLMRVREAETIEGRRSWTDEFREGLGFFRRRRELLWLCLFFAVLNFALSPFWYVYLLPFSESTLHSGVQGFGYLNAVETLGLVVASVIMTYLGRASNRRLFVLFSMLAYGGAIALFSSVGDVTASLAAIFLVGFTVPFGNVVTSSYYQEVVPDELRGRVFGVRNFLVFSPIPFGIILGGFLSQLYPVPDLMLLSGVAMMAFVAVCFLVPSLKRMNEPLATPGP